MTDKCPLRLRSHRCSNATIPLKSNRLVALLCKEIAGGFLCVPEHRRGKQLRGFSAVGEALRDDRLMPFAERFGVQPNVVHNIREPPRVERPAFQVVHDLGFYLLHYDFSFLGQV